MKGQCFCKTIEYTLDAAPIFTNCCHCRDCQSLSGSSFALNIMVEASNVTVTSATQLIEKQEQRRDRDPSSAKSFHCPTCAAMIYATNAMFGDGLLFVRAGTLAESENIEPNAHFFIRSKHPWITIPDGVPTYRALPGPSDGPLFNAEAKARVDAVVKRPS